MAAKVACTLIYGALLLFTSFSCAILGGDSEDEFKFNNVRITYIDTLGSYKFISDTAGNASLEAVGIAVLPPDTFTRRLDSAKTSAAAESTLVRNVLLGLSEGCANVLAIDATLLRNCVVSDFGLALKSSDAIIQVRKRPLDIDSVCLKATSQYSLTTSDITRILRCMRGERN